MGDAPERSRQATGRTRAVSTSERRHTMGLFGHSTDPAVLARLELLERKVNAIADALGIDASALVAPQGGITIEAAVIAELRALMAAGRKIEAIKRVREETGLGLREAKDFVERGL